jgi:hypothetical protein
MSSQLCPTCGRPLPPSISRRLPNFNDPLEHLTSPNEALRFLRAESAAVKSFDREADIQLDLPFSKEERDG